MWIKITDLRDGRGGVTHFSEYIKNVNVSILVLKILKIF